MKQNYISNLDNVKKQIMDLEAKALKESAKVLRKAVKNNVPIDKGDLKKSVATWVKKDRKTGEVSLQIGVYDKRRALKKGLKYAYYAFLVEFGTSRTTAQPFLKNTVMGNLEEIRKAQAEYLGQITKIKNPNYDDADIDEVDDE